MTHPPMTTPAQVMERHASTWVACPKCFERFERLRQLAGLGKYTATYCEHNGVRVGWDAVHITLDLCASRAEAERMDEGMRRFLAQGEAFAKRLPPPNDDKPN